jgi:hypothetical protein
LVRPAYLFLVILCPCLVGMAFGMVHCFRQTTRAKLVCLSFLCCVLPVIAYCGLRWAVVGQFGIVSFGGYNLIGVSGQFLDEGDLSGLPADLRPLAESALQHRRAASPRGPYGHEAPLHYLRMETEYDPTIWSDFAPAAMELKTETPVNVQLKRLGTALVLRHPRSYAVWLVKSVRQAAKKLGWDFLDNPAYLLVSLIAWGLVPFSMALPGVVWPGTSPTIRVLKLSFLMSVTYATLSLALVILVCPPLGRFTDAAGVFLGMPLFCGLIVLCRRERDLID